MTTPGPRSISSLIQSKIRAMPALDRVSMVFFLAALVLVASDKIYLGHYSQSPNYLAILAVVGAVFGLVNRTGPALIAARAR